MCVCVCVGGIIVAVYYVVVAGSGYDCCVIVGVNVVGYCGGCVAVAMRCWCIC